MADAALSITASPLAALLTATPPDVSAATATAPSADPFAALLAIAVAPRAKIDIAASQPTDPVAALLATAVAPKTNIPVAAAQVADPATAPLASQSAMPVAPPVGPPVVLPQTKAAAAAPLPVPMSVAAPVAVSTVAPSVEVEAASAVIKDDAADHDKPVAKDENEDADPLADAIASGPTAVLALAPAIVTPVPAQAPVPVPVQTAIPTDAPVAEDAPRKIGNVATGMDRGTPLKSPVQSASSNSATTAIPADVARTPKGEREGPASTQSHAAQAPVADTNPTTAPLPPEALRAVIVTLQQSDEASAQTSPAAIAPPAAATGVAAKVEGEQPQQPVVQAAQQQAAPAQVQPRRRGDELAAPRRVSDTRRRAETASADPQPVGLAQRATETAPAPAAEISAPVAAKGDLLVQQTLTIAKDGAWLDRLAHDIASSAGNGGNLHFKLEPQNLGALSVAISQSADGASIRMTADNDTTRNILLDAQPKLIAEARAHGLRVSDTQVDLNQNHSHNQGANQDASRSPQGSSGQNSTAQNGQNRQSSPDHQPFVSNLVRKAEAESESPERDTDALYA